MTVDELREACQGESVLLRLPPPNSQGYTRRLFGTGGPRGTIIVGTPDGGQTVRFRSRDVLRAVDALGH